MEFDKTILEKAHKHCSKHRQEILNSKLCGCFYCESVFKPSEITEWTDEDENNRGQTALCPECGIDSVIGEKSGYPVTDVEFLKEMHKYWFDRTVTI